MIEVIPAIDIRGGKVVRLAQGASDKETVYPDSPAEVAKRWASSGAKLIHVVDLDGAFEGRPKNFETVKSIIRKAGVKIELGGGIRDEASLKAAFEAGVEKAVVGTKALDEKFLSDAVKKFSDRIVVGIDAREGIVYTEGWVSDAGVKAPELIRKIRAAGIKKINYTDISKDGMLQGPNIDSLKDILKIAGIDVVASGGISTIEDVRRLKTLEKDGLKGIIIGKALYENRIDLKEAIALCSQKE